MSCYIYKLTASRPELMQTMTEDEAKALAAHNAHLKKLMAAGRLVLAGVCADGAFGVVIFEAATEEEARALMAEDPAVKHRVLNAELHPFHPPLVPRTER